MADDLRPWRYARNNHDAYTPLPCGRCGQPPEVEWLDATQMGDAGRWDRPGRHWCTTPGCVDEKGSNDVPQMYGMERL